MSDRLQLLTSNRFDWDFTESFTLMVKANFANTADQRDAQGDATFFETGIGIAFRPVENDRLNMLAKFTYLYDLPGLYQLSTGTDQRSYIASLEGIYRISRRWEIGSKLSQRQSELRQSRGAGEWFEKHHLVRCGAGALQPDPQMGRNAGIPDS